MTRANTNIEQRTWLTEPEYAYEMGRKIHACERVFAVADQQPQRMSFEPMVAIEELARATKTYRAALLLASRGYGQQTQILARAIFESAMLISWALRHPVEAEEQVQLHMLLAFDLHMASRRNTGFWKDKPSPSELTQEERERAVRLFGRRGTGYWSGHRQLEDLVDDNAAELTDQYEIDRFKATFSVLIGWANRMTHSTGLSTRSHRSENPNDPDSSDETLVVITGPSRHQVFDALQTTVTSYLLALYPVIEGSASTLMESLNEAAGLVWRAWKPPHVLQGLADDDPCPCDAPGTLWGDCHKWTDGVAERVGEHGSTVNRPQNRAERRSRRRRSACS